MCTGIERSAPFGQGNARPLLCTTGATLDGPLDVAFRPVINHFRGRQSVELHLVDWRAASSPDRTKQAAHL